MSFEGYNDYCGSMPQSTHVVQWGGSHVWKIGGKVFAIGGDKGKDVPFVTFKCSELGFEMLREQAGLRPAPYLASRGFKWIQMYHEPGLKKEELESYLSGSYDLVVLGLTKKLRKELNL